MGMNMAKMMKQVQRLQQDIARVQEETAAKTVSATAGGGAVTATVNGKHQLVALQLEPELLADGDAEMVADLVLTAVNGALQQADAMVAQAMEQVTGNAKLPNLPGLWG